MINRINQIKIIFAIFIILVLIIITRGHDSWIVSLIHLPDFTIPALFIAGVYLRKFWVVLVIIFTVVAIDNYAVVYQGISANCITYAYSVLLLSYYGIFWVSKYLSSLCIDNYIVKNSLIIISVSIIQWFVATISYFAFTTSEWSQFGVYVAYWSIIEIPLVLYPMITVVLVFTLNNHYAFMPYFLDQRHRVKY